MGVRKIFLGLLAVIVHFSFVLVKLEEKKLAKAEKQGEFWSAWWRRVFSYLLVDSRFYL